MFRDAVHIDCWKLLPGAEFGRKSSLSWTWLLAQIDIYRPLVIFLLQRYLSLACLSSGETKALLFCQESLPLLLHSLSIQPFSLAPVGDGRSAADVDEISDLFPFQSLSFRVVAWIYIDTHTHTHTPLGQKRGLNHTQSSERRNLLWARGFAIHSSDSLNSVNYYPTSYLSRGD